MSDVAEVRVVERDGLALGLAASPLLLCVAGIVGAAVSGPAALLLVPYGALFATLALGYAWRRNPWPGLREESLDVHADALWVGTERIARADIAGGYVAPRYGETVVVLQRRGLSPALELVVRDRREGLRLLARLGLTAKDAVARFPAMSRVHVHLGYVVCTMIAWGIGGTLLGHGLPPLVGPTGAAFAAVAWLSLVLAFLLLPSHVEVGADGVLVRWLGWRRFVRSADIAAAALEALGHGHARRYILVLDLQDGERVQVPLGTSMWDFGHSQAVFKRINEARASFATSGEPAHAEALVRKPKQSHRDWVRALRDAPGLATHRRAATQPADLWRILEDPGADPLERAAAATTLGASAEGDPPRVARIAQATAAPRLRIALERAARGDDDALAVALAALEREAPR
jgi:hypothetical protein